VRQLEAFLAALEAEERERLVELLTLISVGTQGGRDSVNRLLKDLRRAD
jgi:hypothetical protein